MADSRERAEVAGSPLSFEDFKQENGISFWWASTLMTMTGYKDMVSFTKVINRATKACITLGISHYENFIPVTREIDGVDVHDFKLTRFACYLTVMNGDPKKESVAKAQVYFAEQTRQFEVYIQHSAELERIVIRDELKEGNRALSRAAKGGGVGDYAKFVNAGYLGLYNMINVDLARRRQIDPKTLTDHMGRTELAANLFRVTQTEERIKHQKIKGQTDLERTHFEVGREVREIVSKNTGTTPEELPVGRELPEIQRELKRGYKKMLLADKTSKKPKKKPRTSD